MKKIAEKKGKKSNEECIEVCQSSPQKLTAKSKKMDVFCRRAAEFYECIECIYTCKKQSDWNKHILTKKHKKNMNIEDEEKTYICNHCNKKYDKYKSFWSHTKKCFHEINENEERPPQEKPQEKTQIISEFNKDISIDFVNRLLEQNGELRNLLILQSERINEQTEKLNEQGSILNELQTKQTMVVNNHNTMNNKFNLNVFLNEQCKDAMNLMDFVKNIQITNEDIENNGQLGFVGGISKIFLDNLKQLSVYERPIHCTDIKRETMYIKSDDRWQKEEDKMKLQKAITEISRKSVAKINQWKVETPEYENMDSPEFMRGIIMSNNSMAGHNRESYADKIIRLLAKETMVDKNNLLL